MANGTLRILLAEDDFATRRVMQRILELRGRCDVAVNGREAVQAFEAALQASEAYDLIVLDVMMPELDGRSTLRRIRQVEQERGIQPGDGCKIVMATALGDAKTVVGSFKDLCDGYLVKPIDARKLAAELDRLGLVGQPSSPRS